MTIEEFVNAVLEHGQYAGITLTLFICGVGVPLPEEIVFLLAGYFGAKHGANVWLLCFCGVLGILLGDSIPYWVGRRFGTKVLTRRPFSWFLNEKGIEKTRKFFDQNGSKTIFVGRFFAGLRMPTFFMAGSMHVPYLTFLSWDLAGALISCPTSIWLAYTFGQRAEAMLSQSKPALFGFLGLIIVYMVYHVWSHREKPAECIIAEKAVLPKAVQNEKPTVKAPDELPV